MKHGSGALGAVALLAGAVGFAGGWAAREGPEPAAPPARVSPTRAAPAEARPPAPVSIPEAPIPSPAPAPAATEPPRARPPRVIERESPAPETTPEFPKSQEELLASVGYDVSAALGLKERSERFVQARAYLSKEAEREETAASLELARSQKQEIGEEAYSYMLWSAGIPNRVAVNEVVPDSSASRLGIRSGDVVLRYDGERVFEMDELAFLVREPSDRTSADVEILRDGRLVELSAPRGVLGIAIAPRFDPPREDLRTRRRVRASQPSDASEK